MNRVVQTNLIRFILIFLAQIWIFKQITFSLGGVANIHFLIYPMAILLLPIKTSKTILLILAFVLGMTLDMFYDSPGVHAAALVFTAYIRNIVIALLEPFAGYNIDDVPTIKQLSLGWFVSYVSITLFIHIFVYFSIEAFSFVFFFEIFLNTIFSFIVTFIVIIILQFIFRTKY
ncbi:MAG: hypothetical protein IPL55_14490 [Saprospiraceae bacterium]|jgi:hypothetical protein|nr:hypothetical protein [Saprospiraceae bacterium]MBL0026260.1 hypothetical protein [Saprospiraceae bacterium]